MPQSDVVRNMVSAQLLTKLAAEHGVGLANCLRDTGIAAEALKDPQAEITAGQELQLIRNLVRELGHVPGLGLEAGSRYHLSAYGIWGFALISSPTFRSAAEVAVRFLDLSYAFVRFRLELSDGHLIVMLDETGLDRDVRQFLLEREFAALANAIREMRPDGLPVRELQLRCARPSYAKRFTECFGVEPRFDAPDNRVWLDAAAVNEPLPQSDGVLASMCLDQCRQLLAKRHQRTGIAGKVRDRLFRMDGRMPSLESVAEALTIAPRGLRRRLEEEGTSFRVLMEEVRQALAEELLTTAGMKLDEVAIRLGYSEPAAFSHAFKRWKGISPHAFREQHHNRRLADQAL